MEGSIVLLIRRVSPSALMDVLHLFRNSFLRLFHTYFLFSHWWKTPRDQLFVLESSD